MIKLLWSGLVIMQLLAGCGFDGTATRKNDFTPLTSIEIVAVSSTIAAGTSTKLTVKGNYSGLFTNDVTDQVVWSSATPGVTFTTTTNNNRVTGTNTGTVILTATVGTLTVNYTLTVSSATVSSMTITPAASTTAKGLTRQFTANGTFSDLTTQDLTFDAVWDSSDKTVATIDDPANKGLAHAVAIGTSTVSATFGSVSGITAMDVTKAALLSIAVTPNPATILTISTTKFKATGSYTDGTTPDITSLVTWSSSTPACATIIPADGLITALTQGTTTISASLETFSGTSALKVTGGNLTSITLSPSTPTLVKDTLVRVIATGTFSNSTTRDISGAVEWSLADPSKATVSKSGGNLALLSATAVTSTPTAISAKSGTVTSSTTNLTVTAPTLQALTISPVKLDLTAGTSGRFTVMANYSNGSSQEVTFSSVWASSDAAKSVVGNSGINKGRVTGIAATIVPATITASYGGKDIAAVATVAARTLNTLTISAPSASVASGNQFKYSATATYLDGAVKDVTEETVWSIDKPNVAIIADSTNQPGQVFAVDSGVATLTATFGDKSQTVTITVP